MKKIMKKFKGFTLIELLAVIVILAIILLVVMPIVINVINDARKGAFEASAMGLVKTAENQCYSRQLDSGRVQVIYTFNNGVQTVEPIEEELLKFSGKAPNEGYVFVDFNCNVELKLTDGLWYVEKNRNSSDILIAEYDDQNLSFQISALPNTENIMYINNPNNPDYPENAQPCLMDGLEFTHILDKRDNNLYAVVGIDNRCWMADNLAYTDNGNLPCLTATWNDEEPFDACRIHGPNEGEQQGEYMDGIIEEVLYQWGAVMVGSLEEKAPGLCPEGWYIPTDDEFTDLERYVCNQAGNPDCEDEFPYGDGFWRGIDEADRLKASPPYNEGSDDVGFRAIPPGRRWYTGVLYEVGETVYFWTSTYDDPWAWLRLYSNTPETFRTGHLHYSGYSVRCILPVEE